MNTKLSLESQIWRICVINITDIFKVVVSSTCTSGSLDLSVRLKHGFLRIEHYFFLIFWIKLGFIKHMKAKEKIFEKNLFYV